MTQDLKTTTIRLKMEHYKFLKDSAEKSNRTISSMANWLFEIVWYLEETQPQVFIDITNELTAPDHPIPGVKVRRRRY